MPPRGYKSVTLPLPIYKRIEKLAEEKGLTVPEFIEEVIDEYEKKLREEE